MMKCAGMSVWPRQSSLQCSQAWTYVASSFAELRVRQQTGHIVEVRLLHTPRAAQLPLVLPAHLLVHMLLARSARQDLACACDFVSLGCRLYMCSETTSSDDEATKVIMMKSNVNIIGTSGLYACEQPSCVKTMNQRWALVGRSRACQGAGKFEDAAELLGAASSMK